MALAKQVGAAIVMGTDPDSDRVGIAVPDGDGFRLLNGNETAALLVDHVLAKWQAAGKLDRPSFVAKTVVTTDLLAELAEYGVEVRETLTGFKFIAEAIRQEEGKLQYVAGGKRATATSSGTPCATRMRFQSCCLLAELAHELDRRARPCWAVWPPSTSATRRTKRGLVSLVKEGRNGKAEIDAMMKGFRTSPPQELAGRPWSRFWTSKPAKPATRKGSAPRVAPSGVQRHAICDGRRVARDGASVWHRAQDQVLRERFCFLDRRRLSRRDDESSSASGGGSLSSPGRPLRSGT